MISEVIHKDEKCINLGKYVLEETWKEQKDRVVSMGIYNHPIFVSTTSGFPIQQDNEEIPKTSLDATSKRLQDNINPTTNCPLISLYPWKYWHSFC